MKLDTLITGGLGPLAPPSNPEVQFWYHTDHLGTPQATTDSLREDRWKISTDPFGETVSEQEPNVNNLRFPGQYIDRGSALNYNWHRFYQPKIGRYYQVDKMGITAEIFDENFVSNIYAYAANNGVKFTDPFGLWTNPTKGKIRGCDCPPCGCGYFGAPRTRRGGVKGTHEGVDYVGKVGGPTFATISGYLRPDKDGKKVTIKGTVGGVTYLVVLRHLEPTAKEGPVKEGQQIGTVEDIRELCKGITPHIHLELYRMVGGVIQYPPKDPTNIIPLPGGKK